MGVKIKEANQDLSDTVKKDFECLDGPAICGLRRWKKEWLLLLSVVASNRIA